MRARAIVGGVVSSAAILVIGWHLGADQVVATTTPSSLGTASGTGNPTPAPTGSASTPSSTSTPTASTSPEAAPSQSKKSSASGTFDGSTEETQYGPVQVEIVVSSGKITDVKALQLTNQGGRSVQISDYAAPILRSEALSAQSANVQSVTGATYTSQGYLTSLQSALDKAGL